MQDKVNNISLYALDEKCCGCTACFNACPVKAIEMTYNKKGFIIPNVKSNCINCGKCLKACQIDAENNGIKPLSVYGAKNKNINTRMNSSSGGLFPLICEKLNQKNPENPIHFFGAAYTENLDVVHKGVTGEKYGAFCGSKYVQSNLENVFSEIKQLLIKEETVLFSGTGCQCAGLKHYLTTEKVNTNKLYIIDIVCHGSGSVGIWKDYLKAIETATSRKITAYNFRNKQEGWHGQHPIAYDQNGHTFERDTLFLSFGKLFGNLILNNICYNCKYANNSRQGDITLGDFWGVEKTHKHLDDGKGVSICLVNTQKGAELFELVKDDVIFQEVTDNTYLQPQLVHPTQKGKLYNAFWKDYFKKGYTYAAIKHTKPNLLKKILRGICHIIKH